MAREYKPGGFMGLLNGVMKTMLRRGLGPPGVLLLSVKGRRSGRVYETPVSPVTRDSVTYIVSPYGERGWTKNVRVTGELTLGKGKKRPTYRATEVTPTEAVPVLRQYWQEASVTRPYFDVTPASADEAWAAEAGKHPVFRLEGL
jgi:deazaflavin-dependent oxidoreductase (nitroreductase family)